MFVKSGAESGPATGPTGLVDAVSTEWKHDGPARFTLK